MQDIELTPTREDALEFADYLVNHPQPEPIPIPLAALYELAERAQIRAEVAKIVAKTDQIADEQIDWLAICESHEVDEDCEALRNGTSRHSTPQEDAEFLVLCFLACLPYAAWLIWSVVHFAQKWGLPW